MRRSIGLESFTVFFFDLQPDSITVCRSVSLQKIPGMFSGTSVGSCTMKIPGHSSPDGRHPCRIWEGDV